MKDQEKTKEELIDELVSLRQLVVKEEALARISEKSYRALQESEQKYRLLIENVGVAIIYLNIDGTILFANHEAAKNLGRRQKDLIGKSIYAFLPDMKGLLKKRYRQIIETGRGNVYEDLVIMPTGSERWFMSSNEPVRDSAGRIFAIQVISHEITERKQIEQTKNVLICDVTHALKSPVAMVEMALVMLRKGIAHKEREQIKKFQTIAVNNIKKVRSDIDNMLEIFTLDIEKRKKQKKRTASLRKAIDRGIKRRQLLIAERSLKIKKNLSPGVNMLPLGPRDAEILLGNIIDNAIKFTKKGTIFVTSHINGRWIKIKIRDTGCGISFKNKDRVFEKFYKEHTATEGTGLGLSISKAIADIYNGKIDVDSKGMGKGTTVVVTLPRY